MLDAEAQVENKGMAEPGVTLERPGRGYEWEEFFSLMEGER